MVRLTDRPDMTLDVYRGRKTTIQQQQSYIGYKISYIAYKISYMLYKISYFFYTFQ